MAASGAGSSLVSALSSFLASKHLNPAPAWTQQYLASARPSTPLPALQKTALFRLLASNITETLQSSPSSTLPNSATNVDIKEQRLRGPVPLQVLDIEDIGRSRWSQVEALEQHERGETTKGREIIRLAPDSDIDNDSLPAQPQQANKSPGPHKLLLQDVAGTKIFGFELAHVEGLDVSMSIGAKILLKDAVIARGVVLLEPRCVEILGGKVDAWDREWRKGRKDALKLQARSGAD